MALTTST